LSFNINFNQMSLGKFKRAFVELYKVSGTSFIKVYIKMTTRVRMLYHVTL